MGPTIYRSLLFHIKYFGNETCHSTEFIALVPRLSIMGKKGMKILARYINFEHILMIMNINILNILTYWEEMYFSVKVDYQSTDYFQGTW